LENSDLHSFLFASLLFTSLNLQAREVHGLFCGALYQVRVQGQQTYVLRAPHSAGNLSCVEHLIGPDMIRLQTLRQNERELLETLRRLRPEGLEIGICVEGSFQKERGGQLITDRFSRFRFSNGYFLPADEIRVEYQIH